MSMTDYRALCAELADALAEWRLGGGPPEDTADADLIDRARTLLAQPVAEEPTDEDLLRVAATAIAPYEISGITPGEYEPETECVVEAYGSELIAYARAALARWSHPTPQPPADGEVAELVEWLQAMRDLAGEHNPDEQRRYTRAAALLESNAQ